MKLTRKRLWQISNVAGGYTIASVLFFLPKCWQASFWAAVIYLMLYLLIARKVKVMNAKKKPKRDKNETENQSKVFAYSANGYKWNGKEW